MKQSITLQNIADEAGVSLGTVSHVVNNSPRVSADMARKVRSVIEELGYVPKAAPHRPGVRSAHKKRRRKTNRFAVISVGVMPSILQSPVYIELLVGVEDALRKRGKALIYHHPTDNRELRKLRPLLKQTDGILLLGCALNEETRRELKGFSCTGMMGATESNLWWDHVNVDNVKIGELAAKCMIAKNCLNCAFIGEGEEGTPIFTRGKVFKECLEQAGGSCVIFDDKFMIKDERHNCVDRKKMSAVIDKVMAFRPKISGMFIAGDVFTAGAYPVLHSKGIIPGDDIEIVSCDNQKPLLSNLHPLPHEIDTHAYEIGRRAVELMIWRTEHPGTPLEHVEINPTLIIRE